CKHHFANSLASVGLVFVCPITRDRRIDLSVFNAHSSKSHESIKSLEEYDGGDRMREELYWKMAFMRKRWLRIERAPLFWQCVVFF
ncbi:MAG: hypothetical protein ACYSN9_08220, partial [Planctomycetota bacterium]